MQQKVAARARAIINEAPTWLVLGGVAGFLLLGALAGLAVIVVAYKATIGVTLPLLIAIIVGMCLVPLVDALEKRGMKRVVGAPLVMVLLMAILFAAGWIVITGLIAQWPMIQQQIDQGFAAIGTWLQTLNVSQEQLANIQKAIQDALPTLAEGLGSALTAGLSGIAAFLFGVFIGFYILFYLLKDYTTLTKWAGRHIGLPADIGVEVIEDGAKAIRGYFKGQTVVAFVNTVAIVIGLFIFDVPLKGPIAIVTFILAYIPYLGAVVSGAFAVFIALGSGGATAALGVLAVVLISQNLIQTPVSSWAVGGELKLHPVAVLLATMLGGVLAGALGATLGAPMLAVASQTSHRLAALRENPAGPDVPTTVVGDPGGAASL